MKMAKRPVPLYDFKAFGAAIKAARNEYGESRKKVSDELYISPRYLANIENKGQQPSLQVFLELMSRYHISVDQILHGEAMEGKSTERMQFEVLLDELTDAEIKILTATAQALLDARTDNEGEN
ncbi:MAG TPA: helix-turn-helix transcriptional regulator [Oscillospiraceae bacterium]|mgnify:FL=1|jgi:putative, transcriptional regulator|nr:helix-turn-helix transcriptional regulator [Oscillospiraceae bacterium]